MIQDTRVKVERVPWADGERRSTEAFAWFLAGWARRLSWQDEARVFGASRDTVRRAVAMAVARGHERASLEGVTAIGVDGIAWQAGHRYLTLAYQLDGGRRRLLRVGEERRVETLEGFFEWFGKRRAADLRVVCSDMWKAYLNGIRKRAGRALHVLDRFPVAGKLGEMIEAVRAAEVCELQRQGREPLLRRSRWLLLKRPENLTEARRPKLADLLKLNLRTVRAYLLKEDFRQFRECRSPRQADRFLRRWCRQAARSRLGAAAKVACMLLQHRPPLLNWFRTGKVHSSGAVEGLNGKAKLALRKAYGFKSYDACELALYHTLGDLPEHEFAHKYC